jgi:hypothetical protein
MVFHVAVWLFGKSLITDDGWWGLTSLQTFQPFESSPDAQSFSKNGGESGVGEEVSPTVSLACMPHLELGFNLFEG